MWDLANIMVYIDSVIAIESTVNLEIDRPGATKTHTHTRTHTHTHTHIYIYIYIYIYGGQEMGH